MVSQLVLLGIQIPLGADAVQNLEAGIVGLALEREGVARRAEDAALERCHLLLDLHEIEFVCVTYVLFVVGFSVFFF